MFDSILHPTDLENPGSAHALNHAIGIGLHGGGELWVVHVDPKASLEGSMPDVDAVVRRWGKPGYGSLEIRTLRVGGINIHDGVSREADWRETELVVMATHARDGLDRLLHRNIAEPLARRLRQNTLFLPPSTDGFVREEDGAVQLERVLLPVANATEGARALRICVEFLKRLEVPTAHIRVLHVGAKVPELTAPAPPWQFDSMAVAGNVVEVIAEVAENWEPDLIVMATRGRDSVADHLLGSTVERVLRRSPCPLLALPI